MLVSDGTTRSKARGCEACTWIALRSAHAHAHFLVDSTVPPSRSALLNSCLLLAPGARAGLLEKVTVFQSCCYEAGMGTCVQKGGGALDGALPEELAP